MRKDRKEISLERHDYESVDKPKKWEKEPRPYRDTINTSILRLHLYLRFIPQTLSKIPT